MTPVIDSAVHKIVSAALLLPGLGTVFVASLALVQSGGLGLSEIDTEGDPELTHEPA